MEVFFPAMERTKDRRGTASVSTYAQRVLTGAFPPAPPVYGGRPLDTLVLASGGQNLSGMLFLPPGHWALRVQNPVDIALKSHRLPWHSQGSWSMIAGRCPQRPLRKVPRYVCRGRCPHRPADHHQGHIEAAYPSAGAASRRPRDHARTKRVGRHQAVYVSVQAPTNFDGTRPQWAERRKTSHSDFARRNGPIRRSNPLS